MDEFIVSKPLSRRGKNLVFLLILAVLGIWVLWIHFYQTFPDLISTQFTWKGIPSNTGIKIAFASFPILSSIGPIFILLIIKYRFSLINQKSRIVNFSALSNMLNKLPHERRSDWVNRYFEGILGLVAFLTLYILVMEYGIYEVVRAGHLPSWFTSFALIAPPLIIFPWLFYLLKLTRDVTRASKTYPPQV